MVGLAQQTRADMFHALILRKGRDGAGGLTGWVSLLVCRK